MRRVYLVLLVAIVLLIVVFVAQNRESQTLIFFNQSIAAPLYVFFVTVYLLSMWTGGTVVGFVKLAYKQATEPEQKQASKPK
jgi:uncharacterized integral membrane protein